MFNWLLPKSLQTSDAAKAKNVGGRVYRETMGGRVYRQTIWFPKQSGFDSQNTN